MKSEPNPVYRIIMVRTAQACAIAFALHWIIHWPLTGRFALGFFLTPLLCLYFFFVFVARWSWGMAILTRLPTKNRVVALTFDDGPSPETTPQVLAILREHGIRASFFVVGEALERSPGLLRQIVADGHAVGVHGYHHQPFVLLTQQEIAAEIRRTQEAVLRACPGAILLPCVRPPHGFKSFAALWAIRRAGCRFAAWSLDSRDYREIDSASVAQNVIKGLRPGAVILLHDGPKSAVTAAALPIILRALQEGGWQCVGLEQGGIV